MSPLRWPTSGVRGTIAPDEVHLWAWALEPATADLPAHIEILDQQERERMQRFHFAPDRARYAVAHANLRRILGAYLHQPAAGLRFHANGFGKPELHQRDASSSFHFNLSHSRSIALLAVAKGRPVGVDVEEVRPIEPEVADTHFSASERSQLNQLQGDAWLPASIVAGRARRQSSKLRESGSSVRSIVSMFLYCRISGGVAGDAETFQLSVEAARFVAVRRHDRGGRHGAIQCQADMFQFCE